LGFATAGETQFGAKLTEPLAGFELSAAQEESLLERQVASHDGVFSVVSIAGRLEPAALREALDAVAARHEALRTTFHRRPGLRVPLQVIHDRLALGWRQVDLRVPQDAKHDAKNDPGQAERVAAALAEEKSRAVDQEQGPLFHAALLRIEDERYLLALSLDGMIGDAASCENLLAEILEVYAGRGAQLPEAPLQYADFTAWANEVLASTEGDAGAARAFWAEHGAAPAPTLPLMARQPVPAGTKGEVPGEIAVRLDGVGARALDADRLLAAFQVWLFRLSAETTFAVQVVATGREPEEAKGAIGPYARTVPVAANLEGNPTFAALAKQTASALLTCSKWREYRPASGVAAGSIGFEVSGPPGAPVDVRGARFAVEGISSSMGGLAVKLSATRAGTGEAVRARLLYDRRLFRSEDMARFARDLEILAEAAGANPNAEIGALPVLGEEEQRLSDAFRAGPSQALRDECFTDLFEAQVARTPQSPALAFAGRVFTYAELNARANQLAHLLAKRGVSSDTSVGLCVERSAEMIIGVLGILKAGGAYVPLLADHPKARIAHQLAEVGAPVLVTLEKHLTDLPEFSGTTLCLDRDQAQLETLPNTNLDRRAKPDSLAYIIYTSGSTGVPKGVELRHRNLVNYTRALCKRLGLEEETTGLHFATVSTIAADLGNTCIFPSLASGGCLHVISHETSVDGRQFAEYLAAHPIDVLKITPSHLGALLDAAGPERRVLPRRVLLTGGEASTWELSARIRAGGCLHLNHYGPTETTIGSLTYGPVVDSDPSAAVSATVPIGRPLANTEVHIVDAQLAHVPVGAPGELLIGGAGLSRGYVGQAEQTADRFIKNPFSTDPEARLYRTGDRVRFLADGNIEFVGRVDHQVKIRGFRVEPAEIEAVLHRDPSIRQAVVVVREDTPGDKRLVAYVVPTRRPAPPVEQLSATLHQNLPDYMIPSVFVVMDALPLNPNGKIDRKALPAPVDGHRTGPAADDVAPSGPLEEGLAVIWRDVLGLTYIGAHDSFFDRGGHSLLAMQVIARVDQAMGIKIAVRGLFEAPTIAGLARTIESMGSGQQDVDRMIAELEGLSEADAERLLAHGPVPDGDN
jgi:amino acid adenylation domain-containing protein